MSDMAMDSVHCDICIDYAYGPDDRGMNVLLPACVDVAERRGDRLTAVKIFADYMGRVHARHLSGLSLDVRSAS